MNSSSTVEVLAGVYVRFGAVPVEVPWSVVSVTAKVSGSPSGSFAVSVMLRGVSSCVGWEPVVGFGGLFAGLPRDAGGGGGGGTCGNFEEARAAPRTGPRGPAPARGPSSTP